MAAEHVPCLPEKAIIEEGREVGILEEEIRFN